MTPGAFKVCLVIIPSAFEINKIKIRSAITFSTLFDLFGLWFGAVLRIFRTHRSLMLENLTLRQQTLLGRGAQFLGRLGKVASSRPPRDGGSVASGWVQTVLGDGLQSAKTNRRQPENLQTNAGLDLPDGRGESNLGCTSHPRRTFCRPPCRNGCRYLAVVNDDSVSYTCASWSKAVTRAATAAPSIMQLRIGFIPVAQPARKMPSRVASCGCRNHSLQRKNPSGPQVISKVRANSLTSAHGLIPVERETRSNSPEKGRFRSVFSARTEMEPSGSCRHMETRPRI